MNAKGSHFQTKPLLYTSKWTYEGLEIEGLSLAGIRTALILPQFSIAFDLAQGLPHSLNMKHIFISHGHMDHASGIPYVISQKTMNSQPRPQFYMPEVLVAPMTKIMETWSELEGHTYNYDFHPMTAGDRVEIKKNLVVRAFGTVHRVSSLGYTVYQRKKKLKPEYSQLPGPELGRLKGEGVRVEEHTEVPLISFTGDTQIEFLDQNEDVKKSKILIVECTYLDEKRSVERARQWGHIHLDELIPRFKELENEVICLIHTSSRYSLKEATEILKRRLPKSVQSRVVLFPGR